ncbi:hypothetical protein NQZ68_014539 [Dissostichus eleginoides]|nr:hypothetical protein NQZ68_014539 [Dissostichus eleginoides]
MPAPPSPPFPPVAFLVCTPSPSVQISHTRSNFPPGTFIFPVLHLVQHLVLHLFPPFRHGPFRHGPVRARLLFGQLGKAIQQNIRTARVYRFPVFERSFCEPLVEELEHFEQSSAPKGRPNTMNHYGNLKALRTIFWFSSGSIHYLLSLSSELHLCFWSR